MNGGKVSTEPMLPADVVRQYDGWPLVPIRAGAKGPFHDDWLKRTFLPEDFPDGCNLGVKLGHAPDHLADVDLDCDEAIVAARLLAPKTRVSGRASRPESHYWFTCPGAATEAWDDLAPTKGQAGKRLLEVRATGHQTVLPPSRHPSGEVLGWGDLTRPILTLTAEEIHQLGRRIAVATLLGRHWPSQGRHFAAGAAGGLLTRLGMYGGELEAVIEAICCIGQDEEVKDRVRFARETADKHQQDQKTTGGKTLAELLLHGDQIVALLCKWFGEEGASRIDELNTKHFVTMIGKDVVVGTEREDDVVFQTFGDFEKVYFNQFVGKVRLGRKWLESPHRRTFDRTVFMPPGAYGDVPADAYNLWRGFSVAPIDGDPAPSIQRYLEHCYDVIANGVSEHAEWVLDLMAHTVQFPGRPPGKALALRSPQGLGKSVFVEAFGRLFGKHFMALSSRQQIVGHFNGHLSGKIVVFADEAIWGGNKSDVGVLKTLITQREIPITWKGIDTMAQPNYIHLWLATNEDWAFPAGNAERRGVVLDLVKRQPPSYFDKLWKEVEAPGFKAALLTYLLRREIDMNRLRAGLDTEGLREQKELTAGLAQQWWKQVLEDGGWGVKAEWERFVPVATLYTFFNEDLGSVRAWGQSMHGSRTQFSRAIMALLPAEARIERHRGVVVTQKGREQILTRQTTRGIVLPSLERCRIAYDQVTGSQHVWPVIEEQPSLPEEDNDVDL